MQQSWVFTSQGTLKYDGFEIRHDGVKTRPKDAVPVSSADKSREQKGNEKASTSGSALQREMVILNKLGLVLVELSKKDFMCHQWLSQRSSALKFFSTLS